MRRDFELNDYVLRSLEIAVEAIPETETELAQAEQSADFIVPTPPDDDAVDEVEETDDGDDDMDDDDDDGPRRPRARRATKSKRDEDSDDDEDADASEED